MATKIIINRKSEWINRSRSYKFFIDEKEMGKIANGSSAEYPVEPGVHKLQSRINWCSSPEISIEVKDGETKFLKTGSGMKFYTVGYVILLLSIVSPFLFHQLKIEIPANFATIQLVLIIPFLLYLIYFRKSICLACRQKNATDFTDFHRKNLC